MGVRRVSASAAMLGAVLEAVSFVRVCHIMDILVGLRNEVPSSEGE